MLSVLYILKSGSDTSFIFRDINGNEVIKVIKTLNISKACQNTDIPRKFIKLNDNHFANYTFRNSNHCLKNDEFPFVLQHADVALKK